MASQPCLICGRLPSHAHHIRYAQSKGLSLKVSDEFTVPLCAIHHHQIHTTGKEREWWQERNIDPLKVASRLWELSRQRYASTVEPAHPEIGFDSPEASEPNDKLGGSVIAPDPTAAQITICRTWDHGTRPRNRCLLPGNGTRAHCQCVDVTLVYCFEKITQKEELCRQTHSRDLRRLRRPRSPTANPTASPCQVLAIDAASLLDDLRIPPGNRLEALRGDRQGQFSIRINDQWRICFVWLNNEAWDVEIVDYH